MKLSETERKQIKEILSRGRSSAREQTRARILDLLDREIKIARIAELLNVGVATVYNVKTRYFAEGLKGALVDSPRTGRPSLITDNQRNSIKKLAMSPPPDGHARWTLRLLADKAIEYGVVGNVSHNEIGKILRESD